MRPFTCLFCVVFLLLELSTLNLALAAKAPTTQNVTQQTFAEVRALIAEGDLDEAGELLERVYSALEQDTRLNDEWLGHYYLGKAYLMFAQNPSEEKSIRDVLGLAQSELTQQTASSTYADAWLLQLMINAKHRDYDSVMVQVNEVIQLAQYHKDTALTIDALIFAADFTSEYGNPLLAIEFLRRAKQIAEPLENSRLNANLELSYARFYTNVVMSDNALQLLTMARLFFEENGPHSKYIETLQVMAQNYMVMEQYADAESLYILADDFASHARLPALKLSSAYGLANLYLQTARPDKAVPFIVLGESLASSAQEKYRFAILHARLAEQTGELDLAEAQIQLAEVFLQKLPESAKNSLSGAMIYKVGGKLAALRGEPKVTYQQMDSYSKQLINRLRYVLAGGIEELLAEMEYERVTSKNEVLINRNKEFQRQLEAAEERQRLQWTVNLLGIALVTLLLLFFKRMFSQRKLLKELADTDALTGLLNRRAAIAHAENWLHDKRLHETAFAIFDIDFFKKINDQHGHQIGDRVLQQFADVALANCRESDMLARIGGEEFLLVLPGCSLHKAEQRAEKIRQAFATHTFIRNLRVTASFGVASGHNVDFTRLYEAADRALYSAKEIRNKVCIDPDSPHIEYPPLDD